MKIIEQMTAVAKNMDCSFTFKGRPLTHKEVFAETGLMPGIAKRADQLASLCLGYGIGVSFEETDNALLGNRVSFDNFTPDAIRLLCLTDVLF